MWNSIQKKMVLIILVLLFIMTISGPVAATGSNITNYTTFCGKDITNPLKCNDIAQSTIAQNNYCNNYCNTFTLPSCLQFSCTAPKCNAITRIKNICSLNPHGSAICNNIEKIKPDICSNYKVKITNICTPNCLNTICCGYDPCSVNNIPLTCVIAPIPGNSIYDPNNTYNTAGGEGQNNGGAASEGQNNGGAASEGQNNSTGGEPKINASTVHLLETGLPIGFFVAAILIVFAGLVPKRKK